MNRKDKVLAGTVPSNDLSPMIKLKPWDVFDHIPLDYVRDDCLKELRTTQCLLVPEDFEKRVQLLIWGDEQELAYKLLDVYLFRKNDFNAYRTMEFALQMYNNHARFSSFRGTVEKMIFGKIRKQPDSYWDTQEFRWLLFRQMNDWLKCAATQQVQVTTADFGRFKRALLAMVRANDVSCLDSLQRFVKYLEEERIELTQQSDDEPFTKELFRHLLDHALEHLHKQYRAQCRSFEIGLGINLARQMNSQAPVISIGLCSTNLTSNDCCLTLRIQTTASMKPRLDDALKSLQLYLEGDGVVFCRPDTIPDCVEYCQLSEMTGSPNAMISIPAQVVGSGVKRIKISVCDQEGATTIAEATHYYECLPTMQPRLLEFPIQEELFPGVKK